MNFRWALFALALLCPAAETLRHVSSVHRLDEGKLEAIKQARLEWSRVRVVHPPIGLYRDFRAILHVHAEDSEHTLGTREQVLKAAKDTGVDAILWSDHRGPNAEMWTGYRQGVLFMAGSEGDHELRYPGEGDDLKFLAHLEEIPNGGSDGYVGMEIYNRDSDSTIHADMAEYLKHAQEKPGEWKKITSRQKSYPDEVFSAGTDAMLNSLARYDQEIAKHKFTAIAGNDAHRNHVVNDVVLDPYEVAFRFVSTHILARELKADQIRESLREGHAYVAHDWLCDPNGFSFVASNNFGVYDMGDLVPLLPNTQLFARFPVKTHIKLIHNAAVVFETTAAEFTFKPTEEGAYRLEAGLFVAGEERPWIYSNPFYFHKPEPSELELPPVMIAGNVKPLHDIEYTAGKPDDANKHKLDLYLPADKTNFPVLFFVHGGSWRSGDRSGYIALGNRFAKQGIGVVIPSYRLAPANPHPAQIEDVAAAFAWTMQHIAEYGGDPKKVFAGGHSAGGHLVSLLALDPHYLAKYELKPEQIRGVISLSGVYDVRQVDVFGPDPKTRRAASPIEHVNRDAPPFLITYCENDYVGLPAQARVFDQSLRHSFVATNLQFIPGENHISEILQIFKDNDPTAREMLKFMEEQSR